MFEFLRPLFLLLIPVTVAAFVWLKRYQGQASLKQVIAPHLASALIQGQTQRTQLHWWVLYLGIIASLALAGPSFRQVEVPIVQLKQARVIVMDMSMSMYATDFAPNRLTQAKYKALDLIGQQTEGEQALIAYAGDAFTISPLTQDSATILNLLPNLSPEIMPKPGSNPVAGLHRAIALLQNAGYQDGDIIFITDGISRKQSKDMADIVGQSGWRLSFLAAGSKKGAPITQPNGDLLKDQAGNIVIPQLKLAPLRQLARQTGGTLVTLSTSDKDIAALNQFAFNVAKDAAEKSEAQSMQSIDDGYWLMFLLAPFVLLGFRRGQVFSVAILAASLLPTQGHSQSIWQNDVQNAYQAFKQKNYEAAAELYQDPLAKGAAYFKAEQYEAAEEQFSQIDSADAWYNLANTQVKLEDFDAAISSYETALERQADHSQAAENLARLKDWLAQQKQNEQQEQQSQEQQNQEQQEQQDQNSQQNQQSQEQQEQQDQNNQQNQQSQEQQEQQDQNSQQNQQRQEQQEQEQQDQTSQQNQQSQEQQEQQDQNSQQNQQGQEQQEQQDAMAASPEPSSEEQTPTATQAQLAQSDEEQGNETQEPMPVWLQQMADDPSILLRNKMRLEYQKRNKFTDEGETW